MDNEEINIKSNSSKEEDDLSSSSSTLGSPAPAKKRAPRKPKPTVEGINSPVTPPVSSPQINSTVTPPAPLEPDEPTLERPIFVEKKPIFVKPNLTEEEKELIIDEDAYAKKPAEPKLMPKVVVNRATKKSHPVRTTFYVLLALAILAAGTYVLFKNNVTNWFSNKFFAKEQLPPAITYSIKNAHKTNLTPTSTTTTTTTTTITTPSSTPVTASKTLTVASTPTGYLNVRTGPSTANTLLTQVHPGETYSFTATKSGWYEITLPSGQQGWVIGQYVKVNK